MRLWHAVQYLDEDGYMVLLESVGPRIISFKIQSSNDIIFQSRAISYYGIFVVVSMLEL